MSGRYPGYTQRAGGGVVFILFLIGVILTVCLYFVKMRAQSAKSNAVRLERIVKSEKVAIKILQAELAHLESPARLSVLSAQELGLSPIQISQMMTSKDVVEAFPLRAPDTEARP